MNVAVAATGSVSLGGRLTLIPTAGAANLTSSELVTAASLSGRYAGIDGNDLGDGRRLAVTYTATSAIVTAGLAGDMNLDGVIDILDAAGFASAGLFDAGRFASWADGDFNGDAVVDVLDAADFAMLGLFDAGPYGAAAGPIAAVPEPAMVVPMAAAACLAAAVARRRFTRQ